MFHSSVPWFEVKHLPQIAGRFAGSFPRFKLLGGLIRRLPATAGNPTVTRDQAQAGARAEFPRLRNELSPFLQKAFDVGAGHAPSARPKFL